MSIGNLVNSLSEPASDPVVQAENQTILDLHYAMEAFGHEANLNGTLHGLTDFGETVGLGRVGGDNVITDVAQAPGDVLNGACPVGEATDIITDTGRAVTTAGNFVQGIGSDLSNPDVAQDVVNALTGSALPDGLIGTALPDGCDTGGDPLVSVTGGEPGASPILIAGVLSTPDDGAPVSLTVGDGQNLADVRLLDATQTGTGPCDPGSGNGDTHLITADAGAPGGSPIADVGVLTTPDSQAPVGAAVGNGPNIADANLLGHTDLLNFPDMGGVGTDALTGLVPSAFDLASVGSDDCPPAPCGSDQPLIDVQTDGSTFVQVNDNPTSTLGLNNHVIV